LSSAYTVVVDVTAGTPRKDEQKEAALFALSTATMTLTFLQNDLLVA
jgi:hypothetical protein